MNQLIPYIKYLWNNFSVQYALEFKRYDMVPELSQMES